MNIESTKIDNVKEVTKQNVKNYKELFDFTIGLNEDFFNITKAFDELIEKNAQADIKILGRIIVLNDEENEKFYVINNGIIPTEVIDNVSINFAPERNNTEMVSANQGILSTLFNWVKLKFRNNQGENIQKNAKQSEINKTNIPAIVSKRNEWLSNSNIKIENEPNKSKEENNKKIHNNEDLERF